MRIFVAPAQLIAGTLEVRGDEHHYLSRVRRCRVGDRVELVDGEGRRAAAQIVRITDSATSLEVGAVEAIAARPPHVRCFVPLIKGDRMDVCLEKLVEVGVDELVIWPAARAVVKLDADRRDARIAKYGTALQAAARQSGRAQIPGIAAADSLAAAIAALPASVGSTRFVLDPTSDTALTCDDTIADVTFVSGPEGGLAPDELALLDKQGFVAIGLGPTVLRAETAPIVAVVQLRALRR